ncbi:MAG: hypothetical protein Q4F11_09355 [Eubacteriales bacterium]|nr:hypothetical protein [Eubacteriales bacterium]
MMVRPSEFGMIQQINEASHVKQSELSRPMVEQQNLVSQMKKDEQTRSEQVQKKDNADNMQKKFDAKDKSDNEYYDDGDRHKQQKNPDGRVFIKGQARTDFDVKI